MRLAASAAHASSVLEVLRACWDLWQCSIISGAGVDNFVYIIFFALSLVVLLIQSVYLIT